jgi:hypothetical protein
MNRGRIQELQELQNGEVVAQRCEESQGAISSNLES